MEIKKTGQGRGWAAGRERTASWLLFALLLLCYMYFFPRWADWGQNSKLDLMLAIVDQGTLMIDDYVHNTGDYAYYNGHYYSDKAPGTSFLGVLPYAAFKLVAQTPLMTRLMDAIRANPALAETLRPEGSGLLEDKVYQALALTVITFFVVSVPSALLGVVLYRLAGMFTQNRGYALLVAAVYGLATIAFPYSSILNGRQIAAALVTTSFYLLLRLKASPPAPPLRAGELVGPPRVPPRSPEFLWIWKGAWRLGLVGFLLGLALICDYPTTLIIAGVGLYGVYVSVRHLRVHPLAAALSIGIAALPPVLLMAAYNLAIFGTPLPVGYFYSALYKDLHSTGFISLTYPRLDALYGLTFSPFRGLFYVSPVLLLAAPGFWAWRQNAASRREWAELALCLWAVVSFFAFNSSSAMWWGGFAVGPAYLVPMIPFLALGLVFFLERWGGRPWARALFIGLSVVSLFVVWAETIGGQSFPDLTPNPLVAISLPRLLAGDIARNLGMLLRLHGFASLLPLALVALLLVITMRRFVEDDGGRGTIGFQFIASLQSSALVAGSLFVAAVLTRIPFRSQMLYHWDSVNFALATERYDLTLSQPHAPGYLLYVLAGRALTALTQDPNAAYVWISVLFSGLAVVALYLLGLDLFGQRVGVAAALLGLTSPAVWFHGEVALTYVVEAALVTLFAFACYRLMCFRSLRWALAAALLLGVAGGVRQTTLALMLPLWLVALWRTTWRVRFLSAAMLLVVILAWLAPTIALAGGLDVYLATSRDVSGGVLEMFDEGDSGGVLAAAGRVSLYLFYGLLGGGLAGLGWVAVEAIRSVRVAPTALRSLPQEARVQMLAAWLVPSLLLWAPLARAPGHVFVFLPALILLAGLGLVRWAGDLSGARGRASGIGRLAAESWLLATVVVTNVIFFLAAPPMLFGSSQAQLRRVAFSIPDRNALVAREVSLATRIGYIRTHFSPETTAILASGVDFRHPDYYLPEYIIVRESWQEQSQTEAQVRALPATIETLILFGDDAATRVTLNGSGTADVREVALPDGSLLRYLVRGPGGDFALLGSWLIPVTDDGR